MASLGYFPLGSYPLGHIPSDTVVCEYYNILDYTGLEVGCVWGRGRWGEKKKKLGWGVVCVGGEGEKGEGRWGERREVGELCVCGRKGEVG